MMNICSFQTFGYKYCEYNLDDSAITKLVPVGTASTLTTTHTITLATSIGNIGTTDDDFCELGLSIAIDSSRTEITLAHSLSAGTVTLTTDS